MQASVKGQRCFVAHLVCAVQSLGCILSCKIANQWMMATLEPTQLQGLLHGQIYDGFLLCGHLIQARMLTGCY